MPSDVAISEASDQSLLVSFGLEINARSHQRVLSLFRSLQSTPVKGVLNLHPAYSSLLIRFDALAIGSGALEAVVRERLAYIDTAASTKSKTVAIPVCYAGDFGPDLADLAALHDISEQDVIELHASQTYTVYFLGFVPGFAYLGMVAEQIATPRLPAPRQQVPRGSVGIADRQTGVYPTVTPGGWRLIGRTPLAMFDLARPGFSLLEPGDQVRFQPISASEFYS